MCIFVWPMYCNVGHNRNGIFCHGGARMLWSIPYTMIQRVSGAVTLSLLLCDLVPEICHLRVGGSPHLCC